MSGNRNTDSETANRSSLLPTRMLITRRTSKHIVAARTSATQIVTSESWRAAQSATAIAPSFGVA